MATPTTSPHREFQFPADWESCDAKVTYKPQWKPVGSTPGTLKLSPGRAYRVSVRPETTSADVIAMLGAAPDSNIRTVRIPHGGPISSTDLGEVLAKLKGVEKVAVYWPHDATGWLVIFTLTGGTKLHLDLDRWPVDEVVAALGGIPRANSLEIRLDGYADNFSLRPLFNIRGLNRVIVRHRDYSKQDLDWTGLSTLKGLRFLETHAGILSEGFWRELGKTPQLREFVLWWPRGATAPPGSLSRLKSLKKLNVVCLFEPVPEAFQALGKCPALGEVKIDGGTIDNVSAAGIGSMAGVKDGHIWSVKISDAGMTALCRWRRIQSLALCEDSSNPTPVTRQGFEALGNLATLERLHLQGFEQVDAGGWKVLQELPRLKGLKIYSRPSFDLLEAIGPLKALEKLILENCNSVSAAGYEQLQQFPRLKTLAIHLNRSWPYHIPLNEVGELHRLTTLSLGGLHRMTDEQLGRLANLRNLEELFLDEANKISERGIAGLTALQKLRLVSLHTVPGLTDRAVADLAKLPRLETLFLRCTDKVTDRGLESLAAVRGLRVLQLDNARNLTGECLLRVVRKLPLEEVFIGSSPHVTDEHLMGLVSHPTLKRFGAAGCKNVTADGIRAVAAARPDWKGLTFSRWPSL